MIKEKNDGNTPLNELTDKYVTGNIGYDEFEREVKALYSYKEDMEENKVQHYDCFFDKEQSKSNLKPFDLEAAKAGKPVCTRDGRKARIICFDAKGSKPIIALVDIKGTECAMSYFIDGRFLSIGKRNDATDLMMFHEKKEGWVNVYKEDDSYTTSEEIYGSKEEAIKANPYEEAYLTTVKIEWEE